MKRAVFVLTSSIVVVLAASLLAVGADKDNTPPSGFTALFNGQDTTGWQGAIQIDQRLRLEGDKLASAERKTNDTVLPHWKVENGVLVNDGQGGNLATVKDYTNFELW